MASNKTEAASVITYIHGPVTSTTLPANIRDLSGGGVVVTDTHCCASNFGSVIVRLHHDYNARIR